MEFQLTGKRMLVVGASSGIGRAIAEMAGEAGARVAVSARRAGPLTELADSLPDGLAVPGNVRTDGDPQRIVDETVAAFGGLDVLVYSTGMSPLKPLGDATLADWQEVLEVNVVGAALVTSAAAPHLQRSDGRALLLSSKSVRQPFPDLSLYTTSKVALDGFIRCLPAEFPGLRVTRVVVGNTAMTDFAAAWDAAAMEAAVQRWAASGVLGTGGMMHPRQVAQAVLAVLASAAYIDDVAVIDHETDTGTWG